MNSKKRILAAWTVACFCLAQFTFNPIASAQTAWTNQSGYWSTAGNWVPSVPPGPGTNAFFTNNIPVSYTVTNDILNNTFGNLTVYRPGLVATIFSATDGFNPAGNVFIGNGGTLFLTNSTALIGGSVTISNGGRLDVFDGANVTVNGSLNNSYGVWIQGTNTVLSVLGGFINTAASGYPYLYIAPTDLMFFNNGTLNVGGTNAASANNSFVTLTNTGSLTFNGYYNGFDFSSSGATNGTINASTNTVGLYNMGTIQNVVGSGGGYINATFVNETNGSVLPGPYGAQFVFERFPTNRGTVYEWNYYSGFTINKGDYVNQGFTYMESDVFSVLGGAFINDTNGLFNTGLYGGNLAAQSILNRGTMNITSAYVGPVNFACVLTNQGTINLYRSDLIDFGRSVYAAIQASNIVNSGTIMALGQTNVFTHQSHPTFMNEIYTGVTNLAGGIITTTNGAILGFYPTVLPKNYGTIIVNADSAVGMGAYDAAGYYDDKVLYVGFSDYQNDGTIDLRGGTFGAGSVSNVAGAIVKGWGDVGFTIYSNIVSTSGLTTNYARQFTAEPLRNSGSVLVNGALNAGAINNNPGGLIMGSGVITSSNSFNYFDGETLSTSNVNTGARILNNAGATILASGGTLLLANGLVNNSNAGTIGATNGGTLQLGDGTLVLTNNGTIRLSGGGLTVGNLRNNGSIQLLAGGPNTLAVAGALTIASGTTMSASNSISTVLGIVTNQGTIRVVNSTIAYTDKMFGAGRYISDPSTSTFFDDVTIAPGGTLEGGFGDVFDFQKSLFINSTNTSLFDLVSSTVSFSGGGDHTNAITGLDFDNSPAFGETHGYTATNFAYGTLMLGASDDLYLIDGDGNPSNVNGLYIGVLDIGGATNNLSLLHTPFNIYYRNGLAGNEYLGGQTYALDGGGFLIAVPEPSTVFLLLTAGAVLLRRRSR